MSLLAKIKGLFGAEKRLVQCSELKDLLRAVQADRVPVQVKLANARPASTVYNSYVLKVSSDSTDTALELDELVPRDGNELAQKLGKLTVDVSYQGAHARFTVPITKFEGSFLTPFPTSIQMDQKRSNKRLHLSDLGNYPVEIYSEGRNMVRAALTDVSLGGLQLCVRMDDRVTPPFRQGEIIHGVHITVGNGAHVQLHVEIRSVSLKRARKHILLGAKIRGFKDQKHEVTFKDWVKVIYERMERCRK